MGVRCGYKNPSEGHCLATFGTALWCQTMMERTFLSAPRDHDIFFFLHIVLSPAFYFNVGVAINESCSYTLTSAIFKTEFVCDVIMTSTFNVLTTVTWPPIQPIYCQQVLLFVYSSSEPKAQCWAYKIGRPLSSVCMYVVFQYFQTSSLQKPLGRLKPNFMWILLGTGERKFVQMVLVTWPRWPPCPYIFKTKSNIAILSLNISIPVSIWKNNLN